MIDNVIVQWDQPLEAVHDDGRVLSVGLTTWEDERGVHNGPDKQGDYYTTWPDGDCGIWRIDGRSWAGMKQGWRIRNVAQTTRTTDEQLTHYAERCKALVERMAAVNSFLSGEAGPLFVEARAIVASMVEVDGDLIAAREIAHDRLMALGASDEQIAAGDIAKGERDDAIVVHVALAAIRRGRALERGE